MNNNPDSIYSTLLKIKNNPRCSTETGDLDRFIVKQLFSDGFVRGVDFTTIHESDIPRITDLEITTIGQIYLEENAQGKLLKSLSSKLFLPIAVTVIGGTIVAIVTIFWLQPWQVNIQDQTKVKNTQQPIMQSSK